MITMTNNNMHTSEKDADDKSISKRIDDNTLLDIVKSDRSLIYFFVILGYYQYNENDHIALRILAKSWQIILLVMASIGFLLQVFLVGTTEAYQDISKTDAVAIDVLYDMIIPIVQVGSLVYGMSKLRRQLHKSVYSASVPSLVSKYKKDAVIFFATMALTVLVINPININKSIYINAYSDVSGLRTYSVFVLQQTTLLFYNLAITCYLTVAMLFISIALKQVELFQEDISNAMKVDKITCEEYITAKEKINYLHSTSSLFIQVLTLSAGISVIIFILRVEAYHIEYINDVISYKVMIFQYIHMIPYLFKEIVFFYYTLLKVASANTMNAKLIQSINSKCWTLRFSENNNNNKVKLDDYVLIHLDAQSVPIVFKVGTVAVQRETLIATLIGITFYFIFVLIRMHV